MNVHEATLLTVYNIFPSISLYMVRQRIGRFLSVKKIKSIGYHDTVTFIRKYILQLLQK